MFIDGIANAPKGHEGLGKCSQLACFVRSDFWVESDGKNPAALPASTTGDTTAKVPAEPSSRPIYETICNYQFIHKYEYPFDVELRSDEQIILDEAKYIFNRHLYLYELYFDNDENVYKFPLSDIFLMNNAAPNMDELRKVLRIEGYKFDENDAVVISPPEQETSEREYDDYGFSDNGDNNAEHEIRTNVYVEEECW